MEGCLPEDPQMEVIDGTKVDSWTGHRGIAAVGGWPNVDGWWQVCEEWSVMAYYSAEPAAKHFV